MNIQLQLPTDNYSHVKHCIQQEISCACNKDNEITMTDFNLDKPFTILLRRIHVQATFDL